MDLGLESTATCSQSTAADAEYGEEQARTGRLPDDSLVQIMLRLSTRELLSSLALVCRRWHRLCKHFGVHELVPPAVITNGTPWGLLNDQQVLELALSNASTLERLVLHNFMQLKSSDFIRVFRELPRLTNLALVSCFQDIRISELASIANELPKQLTCLYFHNNHPSIPPSQVNRNPMIADRVLEVLCARCPSIQKLDLDSCCLISTSGLDALIGAYQHLTSLDLQSTTISWHEIGRIFGGCKSLVHLSLESSLLAISSDFCSSKIYAALNCNRHEDDKGKLSAAPCINRAKSPRPHFFGVPMPQNLRSLRLYSSSHQAVPSDYAPMVQIFRHMGHQLQHVHSQGVFNTSWKVIAEYCPNLKSLDLSHWRDGPLPLTQVEEVALLRLIRQLKNLERIALPGATDRVLAELGQFCPKLKEIRFQQSFGLANSCSHNMMVTDRGVVSIAEGCPALEVFCLEGCQTLTVSSARVLAFHCRRLKGLILNGCKNFTDDGVAALMPRLSTSLLLLDLVGCKITPRTVQILSTYLEMTSIRVFAIPKRVWYQSQAIITEMKKQKPLLCIKSGSSGYFWNGLYHRESPVQPV